MMISIANKINTNFGTPRDITINYIYIYNIKLIIQNIYI